MKMGGRIQFVLYWLVSTVVLCVYKMIRILKDDHK